MRILLVAAIFFLSCSKQGDELKNGISYRTATNSVFYPQASFSVEPFCTKQLYTIQSRDDSTEQLTISVVTNVLTTGTYKAGLSFWGTPLQYDDITLNVTSFNDGVLNATYVGALTSGIIRNIHH